MRQRTKKMSMDLQTIERKRHKVVKNTPKKYRERVETEKESDM